jgi:hypothetical protein
MRLVNNILVGEKYYDASYIVAVVLNHYVLDMRNHQMEQILFFCHFYALVLLHIFSLHSLQVDSVLSYTSLRRNTFIPQYIKLIYFLNKIWKFN